MNKKQVLRIISPGIRIKLSFFTVLLIFAIVSVTTVINYNQQKNALSQKINAEIKMPLEFVNTIVLDLENLNRSLVLIEEFKIRVREKKKELTKFRRVVVKQETGFLGTLKDLGKSLGLNLKKKNIYSSEDTYFSKYLSEKEISDFEAKVKNQLKKRSGALIDERSLSKLQMLAEKAAIQKITKEKASQELQDAENEITALKAAVNAVKESEANQTEIKRKLTTLESLSIQLAQRGKVAKAKEISFESALNKALQIFFRDSFQDQILALGLSPEKIRILSYDHTGKENMDTGQIMSNSSQTGKKLFGNQSFISEKKSFFNENQTKLQIGQLSSKTYDINGRQYEVSYRPIFKNPTSAVRAIKIYESIASGNTTYDKILEEDRTIAGEIKLLSTKLRARITELRTSSKKKPGSDKEFVNLSSAYRKLLDKRENLFNELSPAKAGLVTYYKNWKKNLEDLKLQLGKIDSDIVKLQTSLKTNLSPNEKPIDPEEIQFEIQKLESLAEEKKDEIERLTVAKDDYSGFNEQILDDSYRHLRDFALQDFVFVSFQSNKQQLDHYFKDLQTRKMEAQKLKLLREWILSGNSETELPSFKGVSVFEDSGVHIRSRSEAEEMMWYLDTTPIIQSKSESKGLLYDILQRDLLGYNLLIIDRTEGLRQIRNNRDETIRYVGIICLVAVFLAYLFAWFFVRKLKLISKKAEEIEKGNLQVSFPKAGYDEVGILSDSLNDMVVGLREREEMRGELAAAEEIQKRLLPEKLPTSLSDTLELTGFYKAMTGVGGDYYDFIDLSEGKLAFCIGDVSNHGVGPAIIMALFRSQLRSILRRGERNLKKILLELNAYLYEETPDHIFITFFLGVYDSKNTQIEYISAGHIKPLFYDASKHKIHELPAGGLPLGMDENSFFETTIERRGVILDEGDIFFEHTDGLDEARDQNRIFFGRERINEILLSNGKNSASDFMAILVNEAERHTGEILTKPGVSTLNDDMAMIAIRRKPSGGASSLS
ncbi:HAMP domain-containing protein [Leptospira ognonensis]|uniref:HAMP domain-containing protein n=1 Tax=Leptospira ognonensis TaxID=2484945 RepID=A0A4R9JXE5_9LEPT|nr:SpoIIE family protein phosphatase [Leptospira ognonensis]TGL56700.1 HAMP domain-containing protein [Leptospira ognonensis]